MIRATITLRDTGETLVTLDFAWSNEAQHLIDPATVEVGGPEASVVRWELRENPRGLALLGGTVPERLDGHWEGIVAVLGELFPDDDLHELRHTFIPALELEEGAVL